MKIINTNLLNEENQQLAEKVTNLLNSLNVKKGQFVRIETKSQVKVKKAYQDQFSGIEKLSTYTIQLGASYKNYIEKKNESENIESKDYTPNPNKIVLIQDVIHALNKKDGSQELYFDMWSINNVKCLAKSTYTKDGQEFNINDLPEEAQYKKNEMTERHFIKKLKDIVSINGVRI